jgi:hypothetical protein
MFWPTYTFPLHLLFLLSHSSSFTVLYSSVSYSNCFPSNATVRMSTHSTVLKITPYFHHPTGHRKCFWIWTILTSIWAHIYNRLSLTICAGFISINHNNYKICKVATLYCRYLKLIP